MSAIFVILRYIFRNNFQILSQELLTLFVYTSQNVLSTITSPLTCPAQESTKLFCYVSLNPSPISLIPKTSNISSNCFTMPFSNLALFLPEPLTIPARQFICQPFLPISFKGTLSISYTLPIVALNP